MFEISCTTNRCNSERISGRGICNQCRNWFRKIPAQSKVFQKENVTLLLQQAKSEACGMGSNKLHASFKKQPECRGVRTRLWLSQCFLKICALRCRFEIKVASGYEVFYLKILALTRNFFASLPCAAAMLILLVVSVLSGKLCVRSILVFPTKQQIAFRSDPGTRTTILCCGSSRCDHKQSRVH